jgi:uncharacterized membrane protein YbaN (DUF454 family)
MEILIVLGFIGMTLGILGILLTLFLTYIGSVMFGNVDELDEDF